MRYLALSLLLLQGCAYNYHSISDATDFWVKGETVGMGDNRLYYCTANKEPGAAHPRCYGAGYYEWLNAGSTSPDAPRTITPKSSGNPLNAP